MEGATEEGTSGKTMSMNDIKEENTSHNMKVQIKEITSLCRKLAETIQVIEKNRQDLSGAVASQNSKEKKTETRCC